MLQPPYQIKLRQEIFLIAAILLGARVQRIDDFLVQLVGGPPVARHHLGRPSHGDEHQALDVVCPVGLAGLLVARCGGLLPDFPVFQVLSEPPPLGPTVVDLAKPDDVRESPERCPRAFEGDYHIIANCMDALHLQAVGGGFENTLCQFDVPLGQLGSAYHLGSGMGVRVTRVEQDTPRQRV